MHIANTNTIQFTEGTDAEGTTRKSLESVRCASRVNRVHIRAILFRLRSVSVQSELKIFHEKPRIRLGDSRFSLSLKTGSKDTELYEVCRELVIGFCVLSRVQ